MTAKHLSCRGRTSAFIISTYKDRLDCKELQKLQDLWDCRGTKVIASYFKSGNGFTTTESDIIEVTDGLDLGDYTLIRLEFLP